VEKACLNPKHHLSSFAYYKLCPQSRTAYSYILSYILFYVSACVNCVRWSNNGVYLASGGDDKLIMVWKRAA